jgi:hypothetical protein
MDMSWPSLDGGAESSQLLPGKPSVDDGLIFLNGESDHVYLVSWWLNSATAQRSSDPDTPPWPSIPRVAENGEENHPASL